MKKDNFDPRLQTMSDTLNIWLSRNLSLNGKVTILKSLALPKIQYVASCLPITSDVLQETSKIISKFLWKHKTPKVNKNVIIQPIEDGGIKAPDFTSMIKASRVSWVKRLLSSKGKWKTILSDLVHPLSLEHFLQTNLSDDDISCIPIPFYRQILKSWNEIKHLMKNKRNRKHTMFCPRLYKAGVTRLGDLLNEKGKILDFTGFTSKFNVKCNILLY